MQYSLSKFAEEELCQIHNRLDRWEWDYRLGPKPEGWDRLPMYHRSSIKKRFCNSKDKIITPIIEEIEIKVGRTKLLEWHWIHNLKRTKEEFREWLFKEMGERFLRF